MKSGKVCLNIARSCCLILILITTQKLNAAQLHVATASNFLKTAKEISDAFSEQTNIDVVLSSASSGKLYAQIVQGAPFDVFLSADQDKPTLLNQKGLVSSGSQFTYAQGQLVLIYNRMPVSAQPYEEPVDFKELASLAFANPKLAPYGKAAEETLEHLSWRKRSEQKWIVAENVNQVMQFVLSGNVDAGFVAYSHVLAVENIVSQKGVWHVPGSYHRPIL